MKDLYLLWDLRLRGACVSEFVCYCEASLFFTHTSAVVAMENGLSYLCISPEDMEKKLIMNSLNRALGIMSKCSLIHRHLSQVKNP